jgi:hypothetical protein
MIKKHYSIILHAYVQLLALEPGCQTRSLPLDLATASTLNTKLKALKFIKPYFECFSCRVWGIRFFTTLCARGSNEELSL